MRLCCPLIHRVGQHPPSPRRPSYPFFSCSNHSWNFVHISCNVCFHEVKTLNLYWNKKHTMNPTTTKINKSCSFHRKVKIFFSKKETQEQICLKEESTLDKFLKGLPPDLACEVKQCWIEPEDITLGNLLGKGNTCPHFSRLNVCGCV